MNIPKRLAEFKQLLQKLPPEAGAGIELLFHKYGPRRELLLRRLAIPHQVNKQVLSILGASLELTSSLSLIHRLSRLSFLSLSGDALIMHDNVRQYLLRWWYQKEHMDEFRSISARLADYYQSELNGVSGPEKLAIQRQYIYHQIAADQDAGFHMFEKVFHRERYQHSISECTTLINIVQEHEAILKPVLKLWLIYHQGKLLIDSYHYEEAGKKFQLILNAKELPPELYVKALFRMGELAAEQQKWETAASFYHDVLATINNGVVQLKQHRVLDGLATAYRELGRLQEAEKICNDGLSIAECTGDLSALARSYNSIGQLHRKRGDAKHAIKAFEISLNYLKENQERFCMAQVLNNLGLAWADLGEWEKSKKFLEQCLEIEKEAEDTSRQAKTLANLIRPYVSLNDLEQGLKLADDAVELSFQIHDWYAAAVTKRSKARILRRYHRLKEARKELTESAVLFGKANNLSEQLAVEREYGELERKARMPWFFWLALTFWGLFLLLILLLFGMILSD